MATRFDVAQRLFQPQRAASYALRSAQRAGGIQGGQTGSLGMSYGTAAGDSEGGWVKVAMDTSGMVDPEDAPTVSCVCDTPIKDGQRVAVLTTSSGQLKAIPIGQNILDMSIQGVDVQYALSSSSTVAPTTGWTSKPPSTIPEGQYLWQRTATTTGSGTSHSAAVCITSADGKDGRGVDDIQEQYYLSTSSTRQTGGSWQSTCPEWVDGRYIWTRSRIDWTDGTTTYTTPVLASAINQANENAAKATQYCWNDYEGTHVSTSPNSTAGTNALLTSGGLQFRNGSEVMAEYTATSASLAGDVLRVVAINASSSSTGYAAIGGNNLTLGEGYPQSSGWSQNSVAVSDLVEMKDKYVHGGAATRAASSSGNLTSTNRAITIGTTVGITQGSLSLLSTGSTYIKISMPDTGGGVAVEVSASGLFSGIPSGSNFAVGIATDTYSSYSTSRSEEVAGLIHTVSATGWCQFAITPVVLTFTQDTYIFLVARCANGGAWSSYSSGSAAPKLTVKIL